VTVAIGQLVVQYQLLLLIQKLPVIGNSVADIAYIYLIHSIEYEMNTTINIFCFSLAIAANLGS